MTLQSQIEEKIKAGFSVRHFVLENESQLHSRGEPESHFKLLLVADDFEGISKVKRHQAIYKTLSELMPKFHALALHLYTEQEWQEQLNMPESSLCAGGA